MTQPYSPHKDWAREDAAPVTETLGSLFQRTLANIIEHERNAPFGGRDLDALFASDAR